MGIDAGNIWNSPCTARVVSYQTVKWGAALPLTPSVQYSRFNERTSITNECTFIP